MRQTKKKPVWTSKIIPSQKEQWCICFWWNTLWLRIDIDSILFYLFFEERTNMAVVCYEVNIATKQALQILWCFYVIEEFWGHSDKEVNIASFLMTIPCHRAEKAHRRDSIPRTKLASMWTQNIYTFSSCNHSFTSFYAANIGIIFE